MEKMWAGRFQKALDKQADDFNSSIHFDCKMYKQDITGSMAHAAMLAAKGIISKEDSDLIIATLESILADLQSGALAIDYNAEDIHMFVEAELTKRIGDVGKRLHTARSRNDQVAVDIRLYLRDESEEIIALIKGLIKAICDVASSNKAVIMPGYTHLQRAQPITFAHHILAYGMMLSRDIGRIEDAVKRMNYSPLGSCALAGTTYDTDRYMTAKALGFDGITLNSIDGVSDRDFCAELLSAFSVLMMHLSRFSEEIILWSSWEFHFIELSNAYTTGSSIMPQKKNPDVAELIRGKTGRVYGHLMGLLTTMKGIPLAYNKDMQEDKEPIFDAVDTVKLCVPVFCDMIATMKVKKKNMSDGAKGGFTNATDLADYLVKKGMPFREAHGVVGRMVYFCIENNINLDDLSLEQMKQFSTIIEDDIYDAISMETCVNERKIVGGPAKETVKKAIENAKKELLKM